MKDFVEILKEVASEDWEVVESENLLTLETYSGTGEDVIMEIDTNCSDRDFWKQIYCYWENLDVDEEVRMWVKNDCELSIETLLKGAKEKKRLYKEIKDKFYSKIRKYAFVLTCDSIVSNITGDCSNDVCYGIYTDDGDVEYITKKVFCAESYADAVDYIMGESGYEYVNPYEYPDDEDNED